VLSRRAPLEVLHLRGMHPRGWPVLCVSAVLGSSASAAAADAPALQATAATAAAPAALQLAALQPPALQPAELQPPAPQLAAPPPDPPRRALGLTVDLLPVVLSASAGGGDADVRFYIEPWAAAHVRWTPAHPCARGA